jgi:hypothetical protein
MAVFITVGSAVVLLLAICTGLGIVIAKVLAGPDDPAPPRLVAVVAEDDADLSWLDDIHAECYVAYHLPAGNFDGCCDECFDAIGFADEDDRQRRRADV